MPNSSSRNTTGSTEAMERALGLQSEEAVATGSSKLEQHVLLQVGVNVPEKKYRVGNLCTEGEKCRTEARKRILREMMVLSSVILEKTVALKAEMEKVLDSVLADLDNSAV
ncbi:hypothetical protein M758_UG176000 [Ceratodon purpureus]|nr:hypothetical protein M758_UG176000 [Ceratodon purpureus]